MKTSTILRLLALFVLASVCADADEQVKTARGLFTLPKLFDFKNFKELFKKSYGSVAEELARQKLYLARAFNVFVSSVAYKNRWSSSYLSINHLSDATIEEMRRRHLPKESIAQSLSDMGEDTPIEETVRELPVEQSPAPVAEMSEIVEQLSEIVEQPDRQPGFREIARELVQSSGAQPNQRALAPDRLMEAQLSDEPSLQTGTVESNNPLYVEPDLSKVRETGIGEKASSYLSSYLQRIPGLQYVDLALQLAIDTAIPYKFTDKGSDLPDEVFIDHRKSKCAQAPRDQGDCSSCYIFATISLYEHIYCQATGRKVQFSEQYIVDCGRRLYGLSGCDSGVFFRVGRFVTLYGLELRKHYPYRAREDVCPYSSGTPESSMGYLRIESDGFDFISLKKLDSELLKSPLVVMLATYDDFGNYGGGVARPTNCNPKYLHVMLLEGSGREDGQEYWLLRNSYGANWGEKGYYKISKEVDCFGARFAGRLRNFRIPEHSMTKRVSSEVQRRLTDYKRNKVPA